MKLSLPVRSLKKRFFEILIVLFITSNLAFIIIESALSSIYSNLVISESNDKLELYAASVERGLYELQQYSIDILSSYAIQNDLRTYQNNPGTYEAYAATLSLYNQFYTTMINRPAISDAFFYFTDGYCISMLSGASHKPNNTFLDKVRLLAIEAKGSTIWQIDSDNPTVVVFAKAIKSIYPSDNFSYCGVLILNLNTSSLLAYPATTNTDYNSMLISFVNGSLYDSQNESYQIPKIAHTISNFTQHNTLTEKNLVCKSISVSIDGWTFLSILDLDKLFLKITRTRYLYLAIFAFISLLVYFAMIRLSNFICNPLADISLKMLSSKDGRFDPLPINKQLKVQEIHDLTETYNTMADKINYLISEVYQKQLTIADIKYKMLQKQINPHFLYNTLETIHWKAVEDNDLEIAEMTISLSSLLRSSIKKPDIITLKEELDLVEDYITIERIRFEDRLIFEMDNITESDIKSFTNIHLPKITIQPIVENCIRHNLEKYHDVCRIHISFKKSDSVFQIIVRDNGTHADVDYINKCISNDNDNSQSNFIDKREDKQSFGLKNIQYRLQICFGSPYGIRAVRGENFGFPDTPTCIIINLPCEEF